MQDPPSLPIPPQHKLPSRKNPAVIQPLHSAAELQREDDSGNPAADLIRQKISQLYAHEPDARTEQRDSIAAGSRRSKHQAYMYELSSSGKSVDQIQAAWHAYYIGLSDTEKHEVWQEFYSAHGKQLPQAEPLEPPKQATALQAARASKAARAQSPKDHHTVTQQIAEDAPEPGVITATQLLAEHKANRERAAASAQPAHRTMKDEQPHHQTAPALSSAAPAFSYEDRVLSLKRPRGKSKARRPSAATTLQTVEDIQKRIRSTVSARGQLNTKHHLKSLLFGLGIGCLVVFVLLFSFFNERFIAPFITPNRTVSSTPIIIDPTKTTAATTDPKIIIPKINVEVPVVYDLPTIEEKAIQEALNRGVVRYATTSQPGELGNTVIVGHSSNNILNQGKYKFAFVLLSRLEAGDLFIMQKDGQQYVYRVFEKRIVKPHEVSVLTESPKPAMATLITCDPPGTTINRLVVFGEQITPDPASNIASSAKPVAATDRPAIVPGNAPSLFQRLREAIF